MSNTLAGKRMVAVGAILALAGTGCAPVLKYARVRPDYEQVDRQRTKRLMVIVSPLPLNDQKVGDLWSLLARRYVNQKRQFIAKESKAVPASGDKAFDPRTQCGEGLEGVLWLRPNVKRAGTGFEESTTGVLLRCSDGEPVWSAEAGGSFPAEDPHLKETAATYARELGPEVEPYVAPALNLLRPLLDTLPDPILNEQDKDEKIELGE